MNKWMAGMLVLALTTVLAGCGGGETAETPEAGDEPSSVSLENLDQVNTETSVAAPETAVVAPEPEATPPAADPGAAPVVDGAVAPADGAAAVVPGEMDPKHAALVGTNWMLDTVAMNFKDADTVFLKGGIVDMLNADGIDAEYTYADGKITVTAGVMSRKAPGTERC